MGLGEILFTEDGTLVFQGDALQVGVKTDVSFTSKIQGVGNFPSGDCKGEGTMTLNQDGTVDSSCKGKLTTAQGQVFEWKSREKSKKKDRGVKGVEEVTGFSQYPQIVMDTEMFPNKKFTNTGYEWK
jgi:hypothetical protein